MNKLLKHRSVLRVLKNEEIVEILFFSWEAKRHLIIAGYPDFTHHQLVLFREDGKTVIAPFDMFKPSGTSSPNFYELEIIDHGNTIKLGEYEASTAAILEELGY